ncbi:hypothetical protein [Methanopyrus sp.]
MRPRGPVLSPECYDQIPDLIERYSVRFVIINRTPRWWKEVDNILGDMERYLRGTTLDGNDIVLIPNTDVIQTCTNTGMPLRRRTPQTAHRVRVPQRGLEGGEGVGGRIRAVKTMIELAI